MEATTTSFTRAIELDSTDTALSITQLYVGDVGCVVWDSALVLGSFLQTLTHFPPGSWTEKTMIELGAGTGAVGLIACALGADVTITDLPSCLELMKKNIHDNKNSMKGKIEAKVLEWGQSVADFSSPDYILMADVVYYEEGLEKLVNTVCDLASAQTIVYMCYEVRTSGNKPKLEKRFFELMSMYFNASEVSFCELNEHCRSEDIRVFKFVLK